MNDNYYNGDVTLVPRRIGESDELMHFGIKGQKWGIRRWQNEDGTLTPEGKEHYYGAKGKYRKYLDEDGSLAEKYVRKHGDESGLVSTMKQYSAVTGATGLAGAGIYSIADKTGHGVHSKTAQRLYQQYLNDPSSFKYPDATIEFINKYLRKGK